MSCDVVDCLHMFFAQLEKSVNNSAEVDSNSLSLALYIYHPRIQLSQCTSFRGFEHSYLFFLFDKKPSFLVELLTSVLPFHLSGETSVRQEIKEFAHLGILL